MRPWLARILTAAFLAMGMTSMAHAQVASQASAGGFQLSAGATGSGFYVQYGERKMVGVTGFVDADTRRGLGVEAEGRWLEFHKTNDVHVETYSIGARYHMNFRRFQPYAKGLIGFGDFNFPYNYATGRYLVVTAGGGMDYYWTRRIHFRLADAEWQYWPQFTYGAMTTAGVSAGVRVNIF